MPPAARKWWWSSEHLPEQLGALARGDVTLAEGLAAPAARRCEARHPAPDCASICALMPIMSRPWPMGGRNATALARISHTLPA